MTDADPRLTAALADRYRLERQLGRGGMATVFLAQDLKHKRPVALKVLHPELAHALGPERFQREVQLAARLQHPHILTVLDSGEAAGQLWFTMPYVDGESLRDRLTRERQLPVEDALRIATEVARALDYAHRHDVLHRDIKPENILLTTDGDTLVADFGIARALSGGEERLTETGMAVGTPAYMSPEQASGERQLDARTDIYALGAVLYEMLAGEPPFTGPTAQAVIAKRFSGEVPRVRSVRTSVPEPVEQALLKALAPVPADRFATAAEFAKALGGGATAQTPVPPAARPSAPSARPPQPAGRPARRVPMGLSLLFVGFLIGLGVLFAWRGSARSAGASGTRTIAVLPFENQGDSTQEYFADGITDEVRGKLSAVPGVRVIASASSRGYKGSGKSLTDIARELGADYVLIAQVRWAKGSDGTMRVRVSPELVDLAGGTPTTKWQQPFDAALTDVFQVQASIAGQVAGALGVALADSVSRELAARPTSSLPAYDAYLRGEQIRLASASPVELRRASAYFRQALALDSNFALAWARLSLTHNLIHSNGIPSPAEADLSRRAAERAVRLDPSLADAHLAMGLYRANIEGDLAGGLGEIRRAYALAPTNPDAIRLTGALLRGMGQYDSALTLVREAARLDPRSKPSAERLGQTLRSLRRYGEARTELARARTLGPATELLLQELVMVELATGNLEAARAVLRSAPEMDQALLVAYMGTYQDLYWVLDEAQQQLLLSLAPAQFDGDRGNWAHVRAQTLWLRGDTARARAYADTAQREFTLQLAATPGDAQRPVLMGIDLAMLGRKAEAIRRGEEGVSRAPMERDQFIGAYLRHQLARIYILTGEHGKALDLLEELLRIPYDLSPGWLRVDPNFAPLKGNPRFERLVAGS